MKSSWPMIKRCLLRQWWGYTSLERTIVQHEWDLLKNHGNPGNIGSPGHNQVPIWEVEHWEDRVKRSSLPGDKLIVVKYDVWPDEMWEKMYD